MAEPRIVSTIVSADSHVIEPADLWTSRIDRTFRDRAPHIIHEAGGRSGDFFVCEGLRPFPVAGFAVAGEASRDFREKMQAGYAGVRPGAYDPAERLKDQDTDGVTGEFIYPSLGMRLYGLEDGALRAAAFRAYNDWIADYCTHDRARLAGAAMIPMDDPDLAADEVERAAELGLKGGMICGRPADRHRYKDPRWDPLWAAAQDADMPLSLHILTEEEQGAAAGDGVMWTYPAMHHPNERSITDLILGGVFERFPDLKIVSAENDIGWIPHYLQRLDHAYEKYRYLEATEAIPEPPSSYFRRNVYATFQDDRVGVLMRSYIGVDRLMWASDFPHSDSTWPHSRETITREFMDVPEEDVALMTRGNCAALYGLG